MGGTNAELARRGFEAALRGDLDTIADLLDPDVTWHGGDPTAEGACRNRNEALAFMRQAEAISTGRVELVDVVDAGDKVVVITRLRSGGDQPAPATANLSIFRDGKVIEMVHYADPQEALAAAGAEQVR